MFINRSLITLVLAATLFSCNQAQKATADTHQTADTVQVGRCDTLMREYDFPSRRFDETAQDLAHATGCFIEADLAQIGATPVKAVRGRLSIYDALQQALTGTDLHITQHQPGKLKVERKP